MFGKAISEQRRAKIPQNYVRNQYSRAEKDYVKLLLLKLIHGIVYFTSLTASVFSFG